MDEEWVLELMVDVEGMAQSKVTVQGGMETRDKSMKNVPLGSCPLTLPPLATSRTHRLLCQPRGSPSLLCLSQVYPQAPCHAEACFLSWFRDQNLHPEEHYRVTWFLSWSPCPTCAEDVVEFLEEYRNVTLSIYTARLYYFWHPDFQDGLHKLWCAGVHLDIMSFEGESRRSWGDRTVGGSRTRAGGAGGPRMSVGRVHGRRAWETEAGLVAPGREVTGGS